MTIQQPPITIFVVENSGIFVKMLDYICSKEIVFKFYDFKSEADCLANLNLNPSVIVLDHSLSEVMNGSDTIKSIKRKNPKAHIVVLLESGNEKLASKLMNAGAHDYVFKDNDCVATLSGKLDTYLANKNVKRPFYIPEIKPSLKSVGYFLLILLALSAGVYAVNK